MIKTNKKEALRFLINNGLKGILWLVILLVAFYFFDKYFIQNNPEVWLTRFYAKPKIIYSIYLGSEFFFGIIPPELFMLWSLKKGESLIYIYDLIFFGVASYLLGFLNFLIGKKLFKRVFFRYLRIKYFKKTWLLFSRFGGFLIVLAALTPVPWSAVSLLVGSANYDLKKFLKLGSFRLLRYAVYGFIVYQTFH